MCFAKRALIAATLAFLAGTGAASATVLTVDPAHTSATFSVKHLTLTTVSGTIALKSASVAAGPDGALTQADATFDLATIDTHESDRDADLKSDHWFDVAADPELTFTSTKISPLSGGTQTIEGDLRFHGVTNPVTLTATYAGSVKDRRGRTHLGYTATATIDRTKWNLGPGYPPAIVGNDITITIELEAIEPSSP